ncbi:MAG: hypothetical protein EWV70_09495 [Microcystis flos-aquae Mf_QC_C_20070823_S20]|nr:MAG: hypothetical protein EWV70_09495 [Microcystis flos-aquae Mf_QC_C_20070823_S20]
MVANLVANLAALTAYRPPGSRLIVSTRHPKHTRYARTGFPPKAFVAMVGTLERLGYLDRVVGTHNGLRTTLRPTERLLEYLPRFGDTPAVGRLKGAESIILKAMVPRNKVKVLVEYEDSEESSGLRAEMETINAAINASVLTLDGQKQLPVHMVRQFLIPSKTTASRFDGHGRMYWGWWQGLERSARSGIKIDGHPVVELDYSACFLRLSYAEVGIRPQEGDLYEGLGEMSRAAGKTAISALLCRSGPMVRLPDDLKAELGDGWNGSRVTAAVQSKHQAIAPLFGQGIWPRLMFTESQIMVSVLLELIRRGIVALPIHDGLLVAEPHAEVCAEVMREAALKVTGFEFPVARK